MTTFTTHQFQTSPGGIVAPDSTLAPPTVIETDPYTKHVPSMLRIHIQDAQLPAGCNPYAKVSVGANCANSKQLLSIENPALAATGYAYFDEQFVVEYDPRHSKDCFVSVAFFERATNAPLGEWRAPIADFDHSSRGFLGIFGKHPTTDSSDHSWELLPGVSVPLTPYAGPTCDSTTTHHHGGLLSHLKPHHHTTTATTTTTPATIVPATTTTATPATIIPATTTPATIIPATGIPATIMPATTTTTAATPIGTSTVPSTLGTAHLRVRSEPKLVGDLKLFVKEVMIAGATAPIVLNVKFAAPEQRFTTELVNGIAGRYVFPTSEFLIRVDPSNNVRDVFIEVLQNGVIIGETRVTLFDAYRTGGLVAAQPILVHSTKTRIGDMILSSNFDGKVQKR